MAPPTLFFPPFLRLGGMAWNQCQVIAPDLLRSEAREWTRNQIWRVIEGVGTITNRQRELEGIGNEENPNWREWKKTWHKRKSVLLGEAEEEEVDAGDSGGLGCNEYMHHTPWSALTCINKLQKIGFIRRTFQYGRPGHDVHELTMRETVLTTT